MAIPVYWFFSTSLFIVALYVGLGPWLYRRPWALLAMGLITAALAVIAKATPILLKQFPQLSEIFPELDIAASAVDPTLIGLSGGLIAAAFLLKLQIVHAQDLVEAQRELNIANTLFADVLRDEADLKLVANSLTNKEFTTRLNRLRKNKADAVVRKIKAEMELEDKTAPKL
jgi:hypothetical protein